ncbi:hypothetical protein [Pleomorphovibrio marinus]|uniref:hypothetical protein n=1 Tax=Pleomorphovibrio marinus TaxID=2164132 RepID=UPI001E3FEE6A|nr:hypothetical protein [Pleomorphovibrio marinus]
MKQITADTSKPSLKKAQEVISKNLLKILLAGVFIGALHHLDFAVGGFLAIYLGYSLYKGWKNDPEEGRVLLTGAIISGALGVCCELWGIYFGHWEYHDLGQREFPAWLPFAWALAFTFIYRLEKNLFSAMRLTNDKHKWLLALLVVMIFPTLGEIITINMGVWTYNWPLQLFGVPLLAIFLLMVFHSGVNLLMTWICKYRSWPNEVFNPKNDHRTTVSSVAK